MSDMRSMDKCSNPGGSDGGEIIHGRSATEGEIWWYQFATRSPDESLRAIYRGGKTLVQVLSIVIPGYVAALAAINGGAIRLPEVIPLLLWCASLLLSLVVLKPWDVFMIPDEPSVTRANFLAMCRRKSMVLTAAIVLICVGMFSLPVIAAVIGL